MENKLVYICSPYRGEVLIGSKYGLSAGMLEEIEIAQKCGTVELAQSKAGLIEVYNGGQQS